MALWERQNTQRCGFFGRSFVMLVALFFTQAVYAAHPSCGDDPTTETIVYYDVTASGSFCLLCGIGEIHLFVRNPTRGDMNNFTVTHEFLASGIEFVPGTATVNGVSNNPTVSGGGSTLTWNINTTLNGTNQHNLNNADDFEIVFSVRSISGTAEDLVTGPAVTDMRASVDFTFCPGTADQANHSQNVTTAIPIREPLPSLIKLGRNVDASQGTGEYSNPVYGNINDDVIWRVEIVNSGNAPMEDVKFEDVMGGSNLTINYACPTEAEATAIAVNNGVDAGSDCVSVSGNSHTVIVDDPWGNPAGDETGTFIDVPANGSAFVYFVGKVNNSCDANSTNTVQNLEWGCEVINPDGGITQPSTGGGAPSASATFSSLTVNGGLQVVTEITGTNTAQPAGSKGLVTITITNLSGGSVRDIYLTNVLPTQYVVDSSIPATLTVTGAYGTYPGIIDNFTWENPVAGTEPGAAVPSTDPADYLANTAPEFRLWSSTSHPIYADQVNMLRHGDVAVLRFPIVMVPTTGYDPYDLVANVDIREETDTPLPGDSATDPTNAAALTNDLTVDFKQFCNLASTQTLNFVDNFNSNPEDLDIDITGTELIFILTNDTTQPLPLQVSLFNRGGHDADDYTAYVSFGATMSVTSSPASCSVTSNPPPLAYWDQPAAIPATATVYACTGPPIAPGATVPLDFEVVKSANVAADDLTFRADVIGEITLSDGSLSWYPTPDTSVINNRANNYSLDAIRARVIGFNLTKTQVGTCSENNPPPATPDNLVQIGEECTYHIETGGWFGFQTPGFNYIAVQDITVTDELPDGQGYVSSTDPTLTSDPEVLSITLAPQSNPPLNPLDEGWIDWSFNQTVPAERILVRDKWFRVDVTSRILNAPPSAAPNAHADTSTNILNSTFQAVFNNAATSMEEIFNLGPNTIGYPNETVRRVDNIVTEPNILITKEVCNETLSVTGTGTSCTPFVTLADNGDTQDDYVYRITITNEAPTPVTRAPAYNITVTDVLDTNDIVTIYDFASDGLDNDGDGFIDAADLDGEGSITPDNVPLSGGSPTIAFSHTHSTTVPGLTRLDAGDSVQFFYRMDPHDSVAPLEIINNGVSASYDSLAGDHGSQTVVQPGNGTVGGARVFTSATANADVQILPLQTQVKTITALSHTAIAGSPQQVTIGEEIQYELTAQIPVANLRNFIITDNLPDGISCSEAPQVDLTNDPAYSPAGFSPGGQITPVCTDTQVIWRFGNQELTNNPNPTGLFTFSVNFIARVDNTASANNTEVKDNGNATTSRAFLSYINDVGTTVELNYGQVDVEVIEPTVTLTKTFEAVANIDAGDVLTVTVTATNVGTSPAYNLNILDDLTSAKMTYLGNIGGTDPPDSVDTATFGANQPVFIWNPSNPIAIGDTISFSFEVRVNDTTQALEVLDNTIQATWTSLPTDTTALNSTGSIGAAGSDTGMRNGALPNAGDAVDDYESTTSDSVTGSPASMNKTDISPAQQPEVGAHKQYQIEIALPEGTTTNLVANDNLNVSGLSYILANNATYDITYEFIGIATINGVAASEGAFNSFPADGSTGTVSWDIGTVVTNYEDDTSGTPSLTPMIRIKYYARIDNAIGVNAGDTLQNSATVTYTNGETAATENLNSTTPVITVMEPDLSMSKTATLISAAPITGGDIVEYVITITNSNNANVSTAYDINIVDTLPTGLSRDTSFTPTATIGGIGVGGFISTPSNDPGGPLIWGRDNGDDNLDLPVNSSLVLTYRVIVDAAAQSNTTLTNSVVADYTSLQGTSTYERYGNGCPTPVAPDVYCLTASADITVVDTTAFSKSYVSDSYPNTTDGNLRVGDTVTYELAIALQEGTTRNVSVQDVLPANMAFVDIVSINTDTAAPFTPPASGQGSNFSYTIISLPTAGDTSPIFTIGDVANDPLGDATTDTIVIRYRAEVLTTMPQAATTSPVTNSATLTYLDGANNPGTINDTADITVQQPVIDPITFTKTDRTPRTSIALINNLSTDTMLFRIQACNIGAAPAYDLLITDTLPNELDETSITNVSVYYDGVGPAPPADFTYTAPVARGGSFTVRLNQPVAPSTCAWVDYDIGFYTDTPANQTWYNSATVTEYWSLPSTSGKQYGPVGPTTFGMTNGAAVIDAPTKVLFSPASAQATIGEQVVYRITLPTTTVNAAISDIVVSDTLHSSLQLVSVTDVSGNAIPIVDNSVGNNLSFAIAQIPANQQAVIEVVTRVRNDVGVDAGVNFTNTASYTYNTSTTPVNAGNSTSASLLIVEPDVSITKTVSNTTQAAATDAGDILQYTLTITAANGANNSGAFDISIEDTLEPGLTYVANSVTTSAGTIAEPNISGSTLQWNLANGDDLDIPDPATSNVITVTYQARVDNSVLPGQSLDNSVLVRWTSLDGVDANERTGSNVPAVNDYFTAPVIATQDASTNTAILKDHLSDTYDPSGLDSNVRIGDFIQYRIQTTIQEGSLNNVSIADVLPVGLEFIETESINGITTAPFAANAPFTHANIAAPTVTGSPAAGTTVTWNIGNVVNDGDNNTANNIFTIVYRVRVVDQLFAQLPTTQTVTNSATINFDDAVAAGQNLNDTYDMNLIQPNLSVLKTSNPVDGSVISAGDVITYTIDITNSGDAPAYDTVVVDTIPVGMRNNAPVVTVTDMRIVGGTVFAPLPPSYNTGTGVATWDLTDAQYAIPAGQTLRITYTTTADTTLGPNMTLTNNALVQNYYSLDDGAVPSYIDSGSTTHNGVRETYGPTTITSTTLTTTAPVALTKANTQATATIGVPFSYTITVTAPAGIALNDVRIVDDLTASTADMSFVSVAAVGSPSWTPVNTSVTPGLVVIEDTTTGIDIPAGGSIQITLTAVLNDNPAVNTAGTLFSNSATYTFNQVDGDNATQDNGVLGASPDMMIVEPDITLQKSGPNTLRIGNVGTYLLDVHNPGDSTAWDLTIVDYIPNPTPGGLCDTPPASVNVELQDGLGATVRTLVLNTDYTTNLAVASPICTFTITTLTADGAIPPDHHLIISYDLTPDADNLNATVLTNVAGVSQWFSDDTAGSGATGSIRTYSRTVNTGSVGTLDHEDAHQTTIEASIVTLRKTVINATTTQNPGYNATPGDTLTYRIDVINESTVALANFSITDELDRLNASPYFAAGSLSNVFISIPGTNNSNANGGSNGTGLLQIDGLNLAAQGNPGDTFYITFDVRLAPSITSGTVVVNQAQLLSPNGNVVDSDEPIINGFDDPTVAGDEDVTPTTISSAPLFRIEKISTDITGLPTELLAGDTLRYTLTVQNIGTEDAVNSIVRDQIPANTTYVANSTRLNGNVVADPSAGVSPLESGMLVNAPSNNTTGFMSADATTNNVATITFDVTINNNVINGTIISNQGNINADGAGISGPIAEQLSDDPTTATPNDPTLDIVGNLPLVDAVKTVSIQNDAGTIGAVDTNDTLLYTITVNNFGAIPATGVTLVDAVPAGTSYEMNTVTLNGNSVGVPDGGVSPLIAGIAVNSPGQASGVIAPGASATITFEVLVTAPAGTIISNQGVVSSNELPDEPTDADGIDSNGDQPTLIVVGVGQQLTVNKTVAVVGGGAALPGSDLEYTITVTNIAAVDATNVIITDTVPAQMVYINNSATMNGLAAGTSFTGTTLTANYAAQYGALAPNQTVQVRFRATLNNGLLTGTPVTNTGAVDYGTAQSANDSVTVDVGGIPGVANLNGRLWHDSDFDNIYDAGESLLNGWTIQIYRNGSLLDSVSSDSNGQYSIAGLAPNNLSGDQYELRYVAPGAGGNTALLGLADSVFTNNLQRISDIVVYSGNNVQNLNLPIDPNGVIYDSILRTPVAGATVTMVDGGGNPLAANCFTDTAQQGQVTLASGYYKFDLVFGQPGCTSPNNFIIQVTPPSSGYQSGVSVVIPPQTSGATAAYDVTACPADAVGGTAHCEVQSFATAPGVAIPANNAATDYHLHVNLSSTSIPEDSQIFNNHIPLDPELTQAVNVSKVSSLLNVNRGQLVPYTITINNTLPVDLTNVNIIDTMPAGFKYVPGSARLDDVPTEPTINGLQLVWSAPVVAINTTYTIKLLLRIGAGVTEGEYVNRAHVFSNVTGNNVSQQAQATVRVVPDPSFDCSDILGKVFDDKNLNGYQDQGETGIPGVRVVTAQGRLITTDKYGRFHVSCGVVPEERRGSHFILKVDPRSLPSGYRITSKNPLAKQVTRGKAIKFNFGATIHHVVNIDVANDAFENNSDQLRKQWDARLGLLYEQLKKQPSVLRLTYFGDVERSSLVSRRIKTLKARIEKRWGKIGAYALPIEVEVYWRHGAPVSKRGFK